MNHLNDNNNNKKKGNRKKNHMFKVIIQTLFVIPSYFAVNIKLLIFCFLDYKILFKYRL